MGQEIKQTQPAKRGAKIKGNTTRKKYLLNFDDDTNALLLEVGNGNKSEGLHILAAFYKDHTNNIK